MIIFYLFEYSLQQHINLCTSAQLYPHFLVVDLPYCLCFCCLFLQCCFYSFYHKNHHQTWKMLRVLSLSCNSLLSDSSFCTCGIPAHMQDTLLVCEFIHKIYILSHPWSELIRSYFLSSVYYLMLLSFLSFLSFLIS